MADAPAQRRIAIAAALLALVPYLALVARFDFVCDDAYISFRYARNLTRGEGLVFNPGVEPPVEGYSELLWVLAMAGWEALGVAPDLGARILSVAAGALLVLEAGGRVTTMDGGDGWLHGASILAAGPGLHGAIAAVLAGREPP
jgi:hypothetical protein